MCATPFISIRNTYKVDMHYELALELKSAGFPQRHLDSDFNGWSRFFYEEDGLIRENTLSVNPSDNDSIYDPTLSELIEACGSNLQALVKEDGKWVAAQRWNNYEGYFCLERSGPTPEEAVAKLWLELNKK